MSEERLMVLKMLKDGKLSVEEADALLEALEEERLGPAEVGEPRAKEDLGEEPGAVTRPTEPVPGAAPVPPVPPEPPEAAAPGAAPTEKAAARGEGPEEGRDRWRWEWRWGRKPASRFDLAVEIGRTVAEALKGVRTGADAAEAGVAAAEAIREVTRALREELRPTETIRGLFGLQTAEETFELHETVAPGERLVIRNPRGDIRLASGSGREVRVTGRKQCSWSRPEAAEGLLHHVLVTLTRHDNEVVLDARLEPEAPQGLRFRVDLTVEVPEGVGVAIDLKSGDVRAEGLSGPLDLSVAHGDIHVGPHRGTFTADVKSGDLHVTECDGCELQIKRGDVELGQVRGAASVHIASGDLTSREVRGDLRAEVLRGDVEVGRVEGNVRVQVASGDVTIADAAGDVDAGVRSGDLSFTSTGPRVRARVMSGDLEARLRALPPGGEAKLEVMAGDLTARIAPDVRARVRAEVRSGGLRWRTTRPFVSIREGRGAVERVLGAPDSDIALHVMSGDVVIVEGY